MKRLQRKLKVSYLFLPMFEINKLKQIKGTSFHLKLCHTLNSYAEKNPQE